MNFFGNLTVDQTTALVSGTPLRLTESEQKLLHALAAQAPALCATADLQAALYGHDAPAASNVLQVYISRLRQKLQRAGASVDIRTHHARGYALEIRADAEAQTA